MSSPQYPAQFVGCAEPDCALPEVRLNASALSNDSLTIPLLHNSDPLLTLVDSGSTHCFIDLKIVIHYNLPTSQVPPKHLRLFNGSSGGVINQGVTIPIRFPSGETQTIEFLVAPLDPSVSAVLGYSWLTAYNPLIDWTQHSISFRTSESPLPSPLQSTSLPPSQAAPLDPPLETPLPTSPPNISFVNVQAFLLGAKLSGSQVFRLELKTPEASARSADTPIRPLTPEYIRNTISDAPM